MSVASKLANLLQSMGAGPALVHSDPFRAARLVKPVRDRTAFLDSHVSLLLDAAGDRGLWAPTFNYDFPATRLFDVAQSPAQLGPIPERFRQRAASWRTPIPMFSVAGTGVQPPAAWRDATDPFGDDSVFATLVQNDGVVLYYGETFHYNTVLHYAERLAGGPAYRYDKIFPGRVVMNDRSEFEGSLNYHVRPAGTSLDYDWPRLLDEALVAGVCQRMDGAPELLVASARSLCNHWIRQLAADPFALLDAETRKWAEPAVEKLGRRFVLSDFEAPSQ
jgi:aminoglycoside 3-N-acetyltransferase